MTKYIELNSKNRSLGTNNNPKYTLENIVPINHSLSVCSLHIPYTFYQINSSNNTIQFVEGGSTEVDITITPGSYTATTLASEIKSKANAAGSLTYDVTFNSSNGKFTITVSSSTVSIDVSDSTGNELLGFTTDPADASSITSDTIAIVNPTDTIKVKSNYLSSFREYTQYEVPKNSVSDDSNTIFSLSIPNVNFGDYINYDSTYIMENILQINKTKNYNFTKLKKHNIDFYCTNDKNELLDFNGVNWTVILCIC